MGPSTYIFVLVASAIVVNVLGPNNAKTKTIILGPNFH